MVESQPSKLLVAGSIPVSRSTHLRRETRAERSGQRPSTVRGARATRRPERLSERIGAKADVAQLAERVLGKDEVTSSILVIGSTFLPPPVA